MGLIAYLRSRCGAYHVHLEPGVGEDVHVLDRLTMVIQEINAIADGDAGTPGWTVEYYIVGSQGFRVGIPEYADIEGLDVWGSRAIVRQIKGLWDAHRPVADDRGP